MTISSDVRAMVIAGFGRKDVVARYGATSAVLMAYHRAVRQPVVRAWGTAHSTQDRAYSEAESSAAAEKTWRLDQAKAGVMHLVDLKRAGHSPRHTELRISTERPCVMVRPTLALSYCGSSAAMAAEIGG